MQFESSTFTNVQDEFMVMISDTGNYKFEYQTRKFSKLETFGEFPYLYVTLGSNKIEIFRAIVPLFGWMAMEFHGSLFLAGEKLLPEKIMPFDLLL